MVINLEKRLRDAYEQLKKRGIPLASNQVNYSLIYRLPEENGVKAACDELGISLIAYSPIAQGGNPYHYCFCFRACVFFFMCVCVLLHSTCVDYYVYRLIEQAY